MRNFLELDQVLQALARCLRDQESFVKLNLSLFLVVIKKIAKVLPSVGCQTGLDSLQ